MSQVKSVDAKRHYLAAGAIGYFAAEQSPARLRKRVVGVLRKAGGQPRLASAESVGFEKFIYGYGKGIFFDHDDYFKRAEVNVHRPVDLIMQCSPPWVDANAWVQLVWYVTAQITRGPDLEYEVRHMVTRHGWDEDRAAVGYPLNAQRISAAVLRARWQFVWSPDRSFILGDRGVAGMYQPEWGTAGYFLPLRTNFGVMLGPAPYKKQLAWFDDMWHIEIASRIVGATGADKLNQIMWHAARQEVYGPSKDQLLQVARTAHLMPQLSQEIAPRYEGAQLLGLTLHERMKDELLLFRLLGGIKAPKPDESFMLTV